ncbi:hypothetical protein GpartN1_CHLp111 (chloroplast) [Galdieria partita]|uniref:Tic20 family protein Ycf60 n=1 Tax=Galdieria partita TaxID=83374 RepID=A0A9C7C9W6_9RHOD|nr:hypothetical protein GpartN1_CHLp111 [Galdieria partita]
MDNNNTKKKKKVHVGRSRIFWPRDHKLRQEDIEQAEANTNIKGRQFINVTQDMMEAVIKEQSKLNHPLLRDPELIMEPLMPASYTLISFSIVAVVSSTISYTLQTIRKRFSKKGKKIIFIVPIRIRIMILYIYFLLFLEINASFMEILCFNILNKDLYLFFMFNLLKIYTEFPYFTMGLLTFLNIFFVVRKKVLLLNIFRFHIMNALLIGLLHTLIMQFYLRLPEQFLQGFGGKTLGLLIYFFMMSLLGRCFLAAIRGKYTKIPFISTAARKYITDQARGILRQWEEERRAMEYQKKLKDKDKQDTN